MFAGTCGYFSRHPLVRDALIWSVPAIVLGGFLRALMLPYIPYAYWGSDSGSYFDFAYELLSRGGLSMDAKRRYIYPLWMAFVGVLPGSPLRWTAWLQHFIGLMTLVPLAYTVRKIFAAWRWWIVPVTTVYAGLPVILWYEHELIGDCLFIDFLVWACAGWAAWVNTREPQRTVNWCWFFVPFALMILTKPSGRFYIPGILIGIILVRAWRSLSWHHAVAFVAVLLLTIGMGRDNQSSWLLYSTAFPLTRLDTPLHAEYKAQIRDLVEESRANIDTYYKNDRSNFLRFLDRAVGRPLWQKLGRDRTTRTRIYKDLALEGIRSRPDLFLYISFQRILASANSSEFKQMRFGGATYAKRFKHLYEEMVVNTPDYFRFLFALPKSAPIPEYEVVTGWVSPRPHAGATTMLQSYVRWISKRANFLATSESHVKGKVTRLRPTLLGWWLAGSTLLSLALKRYRNTLGVWSIAAAGYLVGTFFLAVPSPRYFAPVWPVLVLLLALPADAAARFIKTVVAPGSKNKVTVKEGSGETATPQKAL